jgi:hypothetical protein
VEAAGDGHSAAEAALRALEQQVSVISGQNGHGPPACQQPAIALYTVYYLVPAAVTIGGASLWSIWIHGQGFLKSVVFGSGGGLTLLVGVQGRPAAADMGISLRDSLKGLLRRGGVGQGNVVRHGGCSLLEFVKQGKITMLLAM